MFAGRSRVSIFGFGSLGLAAALAGGQAHAAASFEKYVAIGDTLTAGFMSGGLVETFQQNSFPAILCRQAGCPEPFEQPLIGEPGIPATLELVSLVPLDIEPKPGLGVPLNIGLLRPYDNLAVPGATVGDAVSTVTDGGGFADLVLRGLGTQVQQAVSLEPTFLTVWIGPNDALGAATSGMVIEGVTLTDLASFESDYTALMTSLTATGAKMAIANVPDVTSIPFVTTIPTVVINPATNQPVLINGQPVPLLGPPLGITPILPGDYVLLTAKGLLELGCGIPTALGGPGPGVVPECLDGGLPDSVVLSASEVAAIRARIAEFNGVIADAASAAGAALVDANALLSNVAANGIDMGGIEYGADFLTGGVFSYDGIHPTPFGYAFVANEFVKAINAKFGNAIPQVDLYPYVFGQIPGAVMVPGADPSRMGISRADGDGLLRSLGLPSVAELIRLFPKPAPRVVPASPGARPIDTSAIRKTGAPRRPGR